MTTDLQTLLDKAIKALPPKSPIKAEIIEALAKRAELSARANKAWETIRANKAGKAAKPPKVKKTKAH